MKKNLRRLKRGDKVMILDDAITGVVSAIDGNMAIVLTEDDFEMEFDISELVLVNDALPKRDFLPDDISEVLSEKVDKQTAKVKRIKPKDRNLPAMEVDLHIHQLVPKSKGMDNYDILAIQIETAKRQLDFAIRKKIQRIVFIHGIGEGVLRAELEYLFRQYGNLQFNDADYQKYGRGAMEVYIFQNKNP